MSEKPRSKKLTRRQPTARSQSIVTHVDAISGYNDRLSQILDVEKSKDAQMRKMEEILFADKLRHAELIAGVSFGHELMELENTFDNEYSELEQRHEGVDAELRELIQDHEETAARVSVAEVEQMMLQSQLEQARARESALKSMVENTTTKNDTLRANEKAAASRASALAKKSDEARELHKTEFDARPANQEVRKNGKEILALVAKAKKLRHEHAEIMKNLHDIETKEAKKYESEANAKLKEHEMKLRAQFTKEELKLVGQHDSYQEKLKLDMERLEVKIRGEMELKEKTLRNKIKKAQLERTRLTTSIEDKRQEAVDLTSGRSVFNTQMKHFEATIAERTKLFEKLTAEANMLEKELESTKLESKKSVENRKKTHHKYSTVIKQNEKMAAEISKFSALIEKGELELDFAPPTKRLRDDKLA